MNEYRLRERAVDNLEISMDRSDGVRSCNNYFDLRINWWTFPYNLVSALVVYGMILGEARELMIGVDPRRGSKPHFHEGYSIGVFHQPSRIHCRGRVWSVLPNQLVLLEPFEVHGGHACAEECPQDGMIVHPSAMRRLFGSDRPMMITNAVIDDPVLAERFSKALRSSREVDVERAISQVFRRHGKRQTLLRVLSD